MISSKKYLIVVIMTFYHFLDEVSTIDFAVVTKTHIGLFSNGTENTTIDVGSHSMASVAYDYTDKDVYFNDLNYVGNIFRINIDEETAHEVITVVDQKDKPVLAIAFDDANNNLYWTSDDGIYYVHVTPGDILKPLTGQLYIKIDDENLGGFAVDGVYNYFYWRTSDGSQNSTIKWICKDRPERHGVVKDLNDPQSIMMDIEENMLYWIDLHKDGSRSLHGLELWGNERKFTLVKTDDKEELMPYAIAIGSWKVYWMDCKSGKIWRMDKSTSRDDTSPEPVSTIQVKDCPIALFMQSDEESEEEDDDS